MGAIKWYVTLNAIFSEIFHLPHLPSSESFLALSALTSSDITTFRIQMVLITLIAFLTLPLWSSNQNRTIDNVANVIRHSVTPFQFSRVAEDGIRKVILPIRYDCGCDGIGPRMIIIVLDPILSLITHIINFSL